MIYIGILGLLFAGCQSGTGFATYPNGSNSTSLTTGRPSGDIASNTSGAGTPAGTSAGAASGGGAALANEATASLPAVLAYLNQKPVRSAELFPNLLEVAGGTVLAEYVLDQGLKERLSQRGQRIEPQAIQDERLILMQTLNPDPNQAQRMLDELRQRRGLGAARWEQFLWRNAAMRKLVQDQVAVTDTAIAQEYDLVHGPRYEARLITTENLPQAAQVVQRARAGESFTELAIRHSTDISRAQGGLLPPISSQDPSYPFAVRDTLINMKDGQVSDPVTLDRGFAVLKLERIIQGDQARLTDVKDSLAQSVRRRMERLAMQRLAREILEKVDLVVTDPALNRVWNQQKKQMFEP